MSLDSAVDRSEDFVLMRLLNVFDFARLHRIGETATHPIATLARPLAALRTPSLESALRASLRLFQSAPGGLVQLLAIASYYSALCLASEHTRDTLGRVQLRIPG